MIFKKCMISLSIMMCALCVLPDLKASEGSIYSFSWLDPDKEVYVLQNRKYRKVHRAHLNIGYAHTVSGAFVDAYGFQGRAGFFVAEDFGFEVVYSKQTGEENETAKSVRNVGGAGSVPFRRIAQDYAGAMFLWAPFYSKINTFNTVVYMDWFLGVGYAKFKEENNRQELDRVINFVPETKTHGSLMWDIGMKFYLNETWHLKADLLALHYKDPKAISNATQSDEEWSSNFDFVVSMGVNLF